MKILGKLNFSYNNTDCSYIRINPGNLSETIENILVNLSNYSWLKRISESTLKKAFFHNAEKTVVAIQKKFDSSKDESKIKSTCGEYIVSSLSKSVVVTELNHLDIPLMELLGLKTSNNPGFDFYTQKDDMILFCGEAKYVTGSNAHSSSMKQLNEFIDNKKHISDLVLIRDFITEQTKINTTQDIIGATAAFSCKIETTDFELIEIIKKNPHFEMMTKRFETIILVGVEFQ